MKNNKKNNKKGFPLILMGLLLIVAALFLAGYNLYEEHLAEQSASEAVDQLEDLIPPKAADGTDALETPDLPTQPEPNREIPDYVLNPDMEMPVASLNGLDYIGVLQIPALELELPILSSWSYPHLRIAPCRYVGSAYMDDLVIAGHNYRSHFGSLKYLSPGDAVILTDIDGNQFQYEVVLLETLDPTATEEMVSGGWDLTLFTCTLGGAYRVTVRCERVENGPPLLGNGVDDETD